MTEDAWDNSGVGSTIAPHRERALTTCQAQNFSYHTSLGKV